MERLKVLIVGSGGREHALTWKIGQSSRVAEIFVAPGNAGTAVSAQNIPIKDSNIDELLNFAQEKQIDLTVVGPEVPLALGIVDAFQAVGLKIFGPTQAAAQLEASKAFAKEFMHKLGIPTAVSHTVTNFEDAVETLHCNVSTNGIVVKASGLAAGKGVVVCDDAAQAEAALREMLVDGAFGAAGSEVVIEERLSGPELSLLVLTDGQTAVPLSPARDHKRAYDDDQGPNTGGMGAFAPPPDVDNALIEQIMQTIVQPTIDGMAALGTPYVGVLYAGLMLTTDGPKVIEFNCRFGDPETQVVLPLLESDLVELMLACVNGRLTPDMVQIHPGACATVVMAAPGYPASYPKGLPITGLDALPEDVMVFHAGTAQKDGQLVTNGGRVLAMTARGDDLGTAVSRAYAGVEQIHFEDAHYRKDIGGDWRLEIRDSAHSPISNLQSPSAYAAAGVDLEAGNRATTLMKTAVHSTFGPEVLSGVGSFGGLFDISKAKRMAQPVLVASTDGVGTKTMVAAAMNRWDTIGHDIVNHCINDILVQGAKPLFFLDYVASSKLNPEQIAEVVGGIAAACREAGVALLGGETAEMPGVYQPGELDFVGTVVGLVDRAKIIDGTRIAAGDAILGLPSSGLHTNGFSLARRALANLDWTAVHPQLNDTVGNTLLTPHRSYLSDFQALQAAGVDIRGLAHITGGGLVDNPPRIFPAGLGAKIKRGSWSVPPIFQLIQQQGHISDAEMAHVFNLGLGMLVIVPRAQVALAMTAVPQAHLVGEMMAGVEGVIFEE
ncbi:MAG: phosphoribosylamine--glycine ligase [Ardenticatenaceae bacterium]|nr:phosphoribosylamine--glycine ligase [Ardenticatenaceae bacterium]